MRCPLFHDMDMVFEFEDGYDLYRHFMVFHGHIMSIEVAEKFRDAIQANESMTKK